MRNSRTIRLVCLAAGVGGVAGAIVHVQHSNSAPPAPASSASVQRERASEIPAAGDESSFGEPLPLGSRFGINQPAPPPVLFHVGRPPAEVGIPDLSTPAVAVQTILSLIDQAATDQLPLCLSDGAKDPLGDLYPSRLGRPVTLVEVIEDEESAKVVWEATVHTGFLLHGRRWSPGETITLTSRLTRVEGRWRLLQLYEGEEDGVPQREPSAD